MHNAHTNDACQEQFSVLAFLMPNRILRDTALDSDRIAGVDEGSEVLFYRLIMLADDFGRFDGRVSVIRGRAFALRQTVTEKEIERRLSQLSKAQLIQRYKVADKPYISIPRFGQRQRAEKSKFPAPVSNPLTNDGQMTDGGQTSAPVVVVGDVYEDVSKPLASSPNGLSAGVNGEAVAFIPLVDGSEFGVSEGALQEFKKAYPALNMLQTMLEIRAWCIANPTKRKTRKGAMRFINSWMARLQDRAH